MKSILLLLFIAPFSLWAQIKLENKSFLDDKLQLTVPADFKPISEEMLNFKYPSQKQRPDVILTDENAEVNIVMMILRQHLTSDKVGEFKEFQMSLLKRSRPDAKWLQNGVKTINGKQVGYFQFITKAIDQNVFNYYFFTDIDGKILFLSFNCIEKLLPKWQETAETIVSSLKIKPPVVTDLSKH